MIRNLWKNQRGYMVIFAYMLPLMVALIAMTIEFNKIRQVKNELKAICDAAAVAGVLQAEVTGDVIYETEYDSEGNIININPVVNDYVIVNHYTTAFSAAMNTFLKNIYELGWSTDGSKWINVELDEIHGEPLSSGLTNAVTGNGVPIDRMDYNDMDEYYFSARVHVKTLFIGTVFRSFNAVFGTNLPVNDLNEIIVEASSKARTKIKIQ